MKINFWLGQVPPIAFDTMAACSILLSCHLLLNIRYPSWRAFAAHSESYEIVHPTRHHMFAPLGHCQISSLSSPSEPQVFGPMHREPLTALAT